MARRFLDDLRTLVNNRIPDNDVGAIDAADVRENMQDVIDSCIQDEAGLTHSTAPTMTVNLTSTWVSIDDLLDPPVIAYDTVIGGDPTFLIVNQANGSITSASTAGFTYEALGTITVNSTAGEIIEAAIGLDGAPGELIASNVGSAGTRPESMFLRRYIPATPASSVFTLMLRAPDGAATGVNITTRSFGVIVLPTNNP